VHQIIGHMRRLIACSLAFALGCPAESTGEATGSSCSEDSTLTYESFVAPFMESYCTRCHGSSVPANQRHGAPLDHNFDTLEGVLEFREHVEHRAASGPDAVNTAMPPSGPRPSDEERRLLGEWLACVADEDTGEHGHTHQH
jgi:uncharacterized membrane protein